MNIILSLQKHLFASKTRIDICFSYKVNFEQKEVVKMEDGIPVFKFYPHYYKLIDTFFEILTSSQISKIDSWIEKHVKILSEGDLNKKMETLSEMRSIFNKVFLQKFPTEESKKQSAEYSRLKLSVDDVNDIFRSKLDFVRFQKNMNEISINDTDDWDENNEHEESLNTTAETPSKKELECLKLIIEHVTLLHHLEHIPKRYKRKVIRTLAAYAKINTNNSKIAALINDDKGREYGKLKDKDPQKWETFNQIQNFICS